MDQPKLAGSYCQEVGKTLLGLLPLQPTPNTEEMDGFLKGLKLYPSETFDILHSELQLGCWKLTNWHEWVEIKIRCMSPKMSPPETVTFMPPSRRPTSVTGNVINLKLSNSSTLQMHSIIELQWCCQVTVHVKWLMGPTSTVGWQRVHAQPLDCFNLKHALKSTFSNEDVVIYSSLKFRFSLLVRVQVFTLLKQLVTVSS